MTKQEQDKRWAQLSDESKKFFIDQVAECQRLINAPSPTQSMRDEWRGLIQGYENVFGSHNLHPKPLTYEDITRELFGTGIDERQHYETIPYIGDKWQWKLRAIGMLLVTAKYLNGDWKGQGYVICINDYDQIDVDEQINITSVVSFRTVQLAMQAIQILGEETIRLAISNDY